MVSDISANSIVGYNGIGRPDGDSTPMILSPILNYNVIRYGSIGVVTTTNRATMSGICRIAKNNIIVYNRVRVFVTSYSATKARRIFFNNVIDYFG